MGGVELSLWVSLWVACELKCSFSKYKTPPSLAA